MDKTSSVLPSTVLLRFLVVNWSVTNHQAIRHHSHSRKTVFETQIETFFGPYSPSVDTGWNNYVTTGLKMLSVLPKICQRYLNIS